MPDGEDGRLWRIRYGRGPIRLLTVPPYFARSGAELLLPQGGGCCRCRLTDDKQGATPAYLLASDLRTVLPSLAAGYSAAAAAELEAIRIADDS